MGILVRNRYQVLERLGTGGGGSVYAVADLGLDPAGDRRVALKALFIDGDADETLLTLLRQEFRVLARLRHPRLARVFDFGRLAPDNGLEGSRGQPGYFFTRDLIEGEDLFDATARSSISQICQLALQTARLLDVLHGAGMIHGDFKPANVIVDRGTFAPHLIDFGLVRGEGTSVLSGTAAYLSPEVISGRAADRRADLYAFGIALYQVIVGGPPLPRASLSELIDWHLHGDPLVPSTVKERRCGDVIPGALDALISRLTERDPDRRYPSAAEVSAALERIISDLDAPIPPEDLVFVPPASGDRLGTCLRELETRARERLLAASGIKGTCAAVVVKGEAGNGKTDLVRELCWRVQLAGVEALRVTVPSGDARVHGPLVDLLDQVAGLVGLTHPLAEARGVSDESARGGGRLLGDEEIPSLGEISGTLGGDEQVDRYAMDQRVVDFLHEAAGRMPLLLVLDAVDQADPETRRSLRFIAHTVERSASLLLVLAQRSGIDDLFDDLPQVAISGLALDDVTRLLAEAAGRDDPILARAIYEHTGGNAQFVLDVMRALWEKRWPIHPDLAVLVPPASLNELARRRWESVGGRGRDVLAALAVVGRPQSGLELLDILDRVDGREGIAPDEEVGLPFERLEAEGWLTRDADGRWAFRDGVAAHRVRQILDDETRRSLHWALYERLGAGPGDVAVRARHALAAGRADLAWVDLVPALATLRRLGAYRRAIDLACAMVEALDEADDRLPEVRLGLGELYLLAGDHPKAIAEFRARVADDGPRSESARLSLARAQRLSGDPAAALQILVPLVAPTRSPSRRKLQALVAEASVKAVLDDHSGVLATVAQALGFLERDPDMGSLSLEAELWGWRAWALGHGDRHAEAAEAFEAALTRARSAGARRVEADLLNRWAVVSWRHGDYDGVEARYGRALDTLREIGEIERIAVVRFNLGGFQLQRGLLAPALDHLEAALRLFEGMGTQQHASSARCNLGQLYLELGLYEKAQTISERALGEMRASGRRSGEALARLLLALVAGRRGELESARRGVAEARELFLGVKQTRDAADAALDLAEVELEAGEFVAAEILVDQAEGEGAKDEVADLEIRALTLRARVLARGEATGILHARQIMERAFARAAELRAPRLHWACHAAAMEVMLAAGDRVHARSSAREGVAVLQEMGADLPPAIQTAFWSERRRRVARRLAQEGQVEERRALLRGVEASAEGPTLLAQTLPPEQRERLTEERFYRLLEIYRQVNSELDPERLLGLVMDTAVELTGAERGFLLLGLRADALKMEISRNFDPDGDAGVYSRSIAERVFSTGEPVVTVSAHNDPRFADVASVHQLRLESVLCIPVHARDRVAGVLYMESRFTSGRFTPGDQRLLMAFGDQVAIALTNARLYAENRRKTQDLEGAKVKIEALAEERGRLLAERTEQLERVRHDLAETRRHLIPRTGRFGLVGASSVMERLFELIARVAQTDVPVLIEGESGTGKEMVARAIHSESPRVAKRLVSINCAAIPENLLESELFGHVRGAFTGADREKKGLFQVADGGSLFLDEIGDMPSRMQVDLLRALQEKMIRPVGGSRDVSVDVRVIAASNKPLGALVRAGTFREDLFYRLHVVRLDLPPLRDRVDDIPLLVEHFLERVVPQVGGGVRKITRGALRQLMDYAWPGNVRQLEHALINAAVLAEGDVLDVDDFTLASPRDGVLTPPATASESIPPSSTSAERDSRARQEILVALEAHGWNKSKTAAALGIPRRTFYRRLKAYDIQ